MGLKSGAWEVEAKLELRVRERRCQKSKLIAQIASSGWAATCKKFKKTVTDNKIHLLC